MRATNWLIISWMIFFAATAIADSIRRAVWDIGIVASFIIFIPLLVALLVFCRRRRPWAFLGSVIFGIFVVVVSGVTALVGFDGEFSQWTTYGSMLAIVLSVLMALEGSKAYAECRSP